MASKDPKNLSVRELERLLAAKRLAERRERLEQFRRTGRALHPLPSPPADEGQTTHPGQPASRSRRVLDRLLLFVEVGAAVGLALVLINGAGLLDRLNREVSSALGRTTPTPLITAVVLPSGHTPPNSPGGAQPNQDEIPANLRALVQSMPAPAAPTSGPEQALLMDVPAIGKLAIPVVEGDGWQQLKQGVGHHIGSADPGRLGNMVLSGHNDIYGEVFRDLDKLAPGDEVRVSTASQVYTYRVVGWRLVAPTEVEVMAASPRATLTLISCYLYMIDTQRIVVTAELVEN
ncbi:MAG: class E sortase [Chloroflexi bacterium]|nr:class E sortase [Chloroflexota bacterium]